MSDIRERLSLLLSSVLDEFCSSDSLSEEGLREIVEQHGLTSVSDYTFFLRACHNERFTEGIIRCLLEYFPHAANASDEDEWTPLHAACFNKSMTRG
eukprot:CAMPEP_0201692108 /NCGR_PEP_ID=MMETSP0578-20130828/5098_1 /ASSEMBLY_ACC=CAM_ASM_000663 /TAXON_ID=267565 /ORGANISM="Skeletonema grethea, Strain CCMP 1804" /LENGTH=96 /DNA_ID=CAMNT_0048177435 /DNA_START=29 /DNA_END=316 /DNA_ORIENTATION=+